MKIGNLATVRDWEGKLLERRIIRICGNLAFVCTDQEFRLAREESRDPVVVGWPVEDVGVSR